MATLAAVTDDFAFNYVIRLANGDFLTALAANITSIADVVTQLETDGDYDAAYAVVTANDNTGKADIVVTYQVNGNQTATAINGH